MKRPHVVLKAAASLDGFLDDEAPERRVWSGPEDRAAVAALRAESDVILVGAETVRADDPSLLVRDPLLLAARQQRGQAAEPRRAILSASGRLSPEARVFHSGTRAPWVFVAAPAAAAARAALNGAEVQSLPAADDLLPALLAALVDAGVERLLVEGGARLHGAFLRLGAFDAFRLALAPTWLGRGRARLFDGAGPPAPFAPLCLSEVKRLDDLAVLHYVRGSKEGAP